MPSRFHVIFSLRAVLSVILFITASVLLRPAACRGQTSAPGFGQRVLHFARTHSSGLPSNNVSDILFENGNVWLGTGKGLSMTADGGSTFADFSGTPGIGKGSISALGIHNGTIWVATAFDSLVLGEKLSTGGGLSWSADNGGTWHYIDQPVDPNDPDSLGYAPTTVSIQNVTFDIAFTGDTVWIVSWAGGLRRSLDNGMTWAVVTPDGLPFSAADNLSHRAFSVISAENGLWVGTAGGIAKSTDSGETWTLYTARNGSGISGNFVTALGEQKTAGRSIIWAASWQADDPDEFTAVSRTENNGLTWTTMLRGESVHNFGFNGDEVYAVSDNGLFKSPDRGETWGRFPLIRDATGERVLTTEYFDVKYHDGSLWVGTADGLVRSPTGGNDWEIFRAFREPGSDGEPEAYAYPNPFSPLRHNRVGDTGHVRIQYNTDGRAEVSLDIFDFGMNLVKNAASNVLRPEAGSYAEIWDGTNNWGVAVANGVYFYRLKISGKKTFWGKVIVMN